MQKEQKDLATLFELTLDARKRLVIVEETIEKLSIEYHNAHESANFIDEYFNDFKEEIKALSEKLKTIEETQNNKIKAYDNQLIKSFIEEKIAEKLNRFFKKAN